MRNNLNKYRGPCVGDGTKQTYHICACTCDKTVHCNIVYVTDAYRPLQKYGSAKARVVDALKSDIKHYAMLTEKDKDLIASSLGAIASKQGLTIQTCGRNGDYTRYGILPSGCMTLDIMGQANGVTFRNLKHRGMRPGCGCIESRDIGAYDTCMNGCKYCYANKNPQKAFENYKYHDPDSPLLLGQLEVADELQQGAQKSFLTPGMVFGQQYFDILGDSDKK